MFTPPLKARAIMVMSRISQRPCARPFIFNANSIRQKKTDYYNPRVIQPIDIQTIINKLLNDTYGKIEDWRSDMRKIALTAKQNNKADSLIIVLANELLAVFEKEYRKFARYNSAVWLEQYLKLSERAEKLKREIPGRLGEMCGLPIQQNQHFDSRVYSSKESNNANKSMERGQTMNKNHFPVDASVKFENSLKLNQNNNNYCMNGYGNNSNNNNVNYNNSNSGYTAYSPNYYPSNSATNYMPYFNPNFGSNSNYNQNSAPNFAPNFVPNDNIQNYGNYNYRHNINGINNNLNNLNNINDNNMNIIGINNNNINNIDISNVNINNMNNIDISSNNINSNIIANNSNIINKNIYNKNNIIINKNITDNEVNDNNINYNNIIDNNNKNIANTNINCINETQVFQTLSEHEISDLFDQADTASNEQKVTNESESVINNENENENEVSNENENSTALSDISLTCCENNNSEINVNNINANVNYNNRESDAPSLSMFGAVDVPSLPSVFPSLSSANKIQNPQQSEVEEISPPDLRTKNGLSADSTAKVGVHLSHYTAHDDDDEELIDVSACF